jgi:hypothetical protein
MSPICESKREFEYHPIKRGITSVNTPFNGFLGFQAYGVVPTIPT